jgi:hypothetical protein
MDGNHKVIVSFYVLGYYVSRLEKGSFFLFIYNHLQ